MTSRKLLLLAVVMVAMALVSAAPHARKRSAGQREDDLEVLESLLRKLQSKRLLQQLKRAEGEGSSAPGGEGAGGEGAGGPGGEGPGGEGAGGPGGEGAGGEGAGAGGPGGEGVGGEGAGAGGPGGEGPGAGGEGPGAGGEGLGAGGEGAGGAGAGEGPGGEGAGAGGPGGEGPGAGGEGLGAGGEGAGGEGPGGEGAGAGGEGAGGAGAGGAGAGGEGAGAGGEGAGGAGGPPRGGPKGGPGRKPKGAGASGGRAARTEGPPEGGAARAGGAPEGGASEGGPAGGEGPKELEAANDAIIEAGERNMVKEMEEMIDERPIDQVLEMVEAMSGVVMFLLDNAACEPPSPFSLEEEIAPAQQPEMTPQLGSRRRRRRQAVGNESPGDEVQVGGDPVPPAAERPCADKSGPELRKCEVNFFLSLAEKELSPWRLNALLEVTGKLARVTFANNKRCKESKK